MCAPSQTLRKNRYSFLSLTNPRQKNARQAGHLFFAYLQVVTAFVVLRQIEADSLFFVGDPQAHDRIQYLEDNEGHDGRVDHGEADAFALDPDLRRDVSGRRVEAAQRRGSEYAGQDRAEDTADTVHAEGIQGVVVAQFAFQGSGAEEAHHASRQADDQGAHRAHGAGSRGDCNQAGHYTRGDAQCTWLTVGDPLG